MQRTRIVLSIAALAGIVAFATQTGAQQDDEFIPRRPENKPVLDPELPQRDFQRPGPRVVVPDPSDPSEPAARPTAFRQRVISRVVREAFMEPIPEEELDEIEEFQEALKAVKNARDDAAKKKAKATLQQLLEKQFARDLENREQELKAVEERIKLLRQQFDKRKNAQNEIIELRLKTIVNNAEGLGFPGDEAGNGLTPGFRGGPVPNPNTSDDFGQPVYNRYTPTFGVPTPQPVDGPYNTPPNFDPFNSDSFVPRSSPPVYNAPKPSIPNRKKKPTKDIGLQPDRQ